MTGNCHVRFGRGRAETRRTSRKVRRTPTSLRGHFAERMRALSETHGMSLAKLLKDSLLVYEGDIEGGYEPGTSLRGWQESQTGR